MKLLFWRKKKEPEVTIEEQIEQLICGLLNGRLYDSRRDILSAVVKNVIPGHRVYRRHQVKRKVQQMEIPEVNNV